MTSKLCDPPDCDNIPPNVSGIALETAMFHTETQESNVPPHPSPNSSCNSWQIYPVALPEHGKATCQTDECQEETAADLKVINSPECKVACEEETLQNDRKIASPQKKKSTFTVPSGWKRIICDYEVIYIRSQLAYFGRAPSQELGYKIFKDNRPID
ncbi:hypothetical protein GQR58_016389 [Nymphon striatum]|nr:hypothetical protein GQR58_016389 [Nymphon striatum]